MYRTMKRLLYVLIIMPYFYVNGQDSLSVGNFPPLKNPPVIRASKVLQSIVIDGELEEPDWSKASVYSDFFMMEPRQAGKVSSKTYVKILFDEQNLYFGVYCRDSLGKKGIRVQDLRRDFAFGENDIFYIQLDPMNLNRYCVSFQTTPYGNQRDLQAFDDTFRDEDWDALWKVRTARTDSGYTAEFAIPFKSLRYLKKEKEPSWGITLARLARRDYEITSYPAVPQSFSPYRMPYSARLEGIELPKPSVNIRANPYFLYQTDKQKSADGGVFKESNPKLGGEIKWAVNPSSVLDFTFNTDFAQADVDRAVNNLTRFNVFFPERRQFFLENSGIYPGNSTGGIYPFFSRTIGLANAQFNANPVPIDAGVRYTDRNANRSVAGMYVHQRGFDSQPGTSFGVFRYLKNYGEQNNIGVLLTHRIDEGGAGFGAMNNSSLTLDGLIRPTNNWSINYLLSSSRNNTNDSLGLAGSLFVGWYPQKAYVGWLTKYVDNKYLPGMGFVFANNTIHHNPGGYYIWRPTGKLGKLIRRWDPGLFVNYYQNADNLKTQELNLYFFPVYIITSSNAQIEYAVYPTWQTYDFGFSILGKEIPLGNYQVIRHMFRYDSDASRKISFTAKYEFGGYFNGKLNSARFSGRLAPIPHFALTGSFEQNRFQEFGTKKDKFAADLYTFGLRLAANPRIQLSTFYQYNSFDHRGRWNVRGSWEFAPLSFLYLIFNESGYREEGISNQTTISKLSYMRQF